MCALGTYLAVRNADPAAVRTAVPSQWGAAVPSFGWILTWTLAPRWLHRKHRAGLRSRVMTSSPYGNLHAPTPREPQPPEIPGPRPRIESVLTKLLQTLDTMPDK